MTDASTSLAWYHRAGVDPWQLCACEKHAAAIVELGFRPGVHARFASVGEPSVCAFCRGSLTIEEVRACRCNEPGLPCPVHPREQSDERDERQRMWSWWLDETAPALELEYEDDRDEMATLVAGVVAKTPWSSSSPAAGVTAPRLWRDWFAKVPPLRLELGADREQLAARLADAVGSAPARGVWGGWAAVPPRPPTSTLSDDELRSRLQVLAAQERRGQRLVLGFLVRDAIDLAREGVVHCADSVAAFIQALRTPATVAPILSTIAARAGVTHEALLSMLADNYEAAVERALDPHVECYRDENCGGADCPPAMAMRARAEQKRGAWSLLELRRESDGQRHYLDGEPVHCGTTIELQAIEDRSDDYGEYSVPLPQGVTVRYEAQLQREGAPATLHKYVGGHEFVSGLEPWMRFRWPGRSN